MKKLILLICCLFNLSYSAEISTSQSIYAKLTDLIPQSQDLISNFQNYTQDDSLQSKIKIFLGSIFTNGQSDIKFLTNSLKIAWSFLEKANATQAEKIITQLNPILTNKSNFAGIQNIDNSRLKEFNIESLYEFYKNQLKDSNFKDLNDFTFNYLQLMLSKTQLNDTELNADNLAKIFNIYTENPDNKELVLFALEQILNPEAPKIALANKNLDSLSDLENLFNKDELRREFAISVLEKSSDNFEEINKLFNDNYKLFFEPVLNELTADQISLNITKLVNEIPSITKDKTADVSNKILGALAQLPVSDDFGIIADALKDAIYFNTNLTKDNLANIGKALHNQENSALKDKEKVKLEVNFLSKVLAKNSLLNDYQLTQVLNFLEDKLSADASEAQINKLVNVALIIARLNPSPNVANALTGENNKNLVKFLTDNELGQEKFYEQIKDFNFAQLMKLKEIISGNQEITDRAIKFLTDNSTFFFSRVSPTDSKVIVKLLTKLNDVNLIEDLKNIVNKLNIQKDSFESFANSLSECKDIGNFLTRVNASINEQSGSKLFNEIVNSLLTKPDVRNIFLENLSRNAGNNSEKPFSDSQIIEALHASGVRQSLFTRFFAKILPDGIISKFGWKPDIQNPEETPIDP